MSKYDSQLRCSFCGKSQEYVRKLIAGPGVYICDECVELCNEILEEVFFDSSKTAISSSNSEIRESYPSTTRSQTRKPGKSKTSTTAILKPVEIKQHLDNHVIGSTLHKKSAFSSSLQPLQAFKRRSRSQSPKFYPRRCRRAPKIQYLTCRAHRLR